jgi:hypothetical protein
MNKHREDAIWDDRAGIWYVPTIYGTDDERRHTVWVRDWDAFAKLGGTIVFNEDQTEITLKLPTKHKFAIRFMERDS